ncbi:MAG: HU family DNA-binding protein, partial [Candidatus Halalkalibacterium sp. M3_1C_030]
MTVNRKKLVDLLVEKTGLEKAEVEEQLFLFMEQLKSELTKGKDFKVPGLGTFSIEGEEVAFTAEEKLSTEINYKYAGMKPIELIGAYKERPDVASDSIAAVETGTEPVPGVEEYSEEMEPADKEEKEPIEQIAATDGTGKIKGANSGEEKEIEQEPVKKPVEEMPDTAEQSPKPADEPAEPVAAKNVDKTKTAASKKFRSRPKKDSSDLLGKILVAAVIIIALGISGWMFYDLGYFGGSSNGDQSGDAVSQSRVGQNLNAVPDEQGDGMDNKAAVDSVNTSNTGDDDKTSEQDESNSTSSVTSIAEASRQSVYGLRGGASPRVEDGYTIVVHSLRDESKVQKLNENFQQQGYRT